MQTTMKKTIGLLVYSLILGATHLTAADEPNYRAFTIGVDAGTTGFGGSASWRFSDNFGIRGGVNYFSYDTEEFTYTTRAPGLSPAVDQKFDVSVRLLSEPIALDYYPSAKSSFRVSLGVLINQNQFTANAQNSGVAGSAFVFNGVDYLQSGFTNGVDIEIEQQILSPYLSVGGSIYLDKAKHWSLSGELGVAYTGSPKVTLSTPNSAYNGDLTYLENVAAEEAEIEKDAEDYKFYPIVKIGVSYSF
jgi:hypothetical protein